MLFRLRVRRRLGFTCGVLFFVAAYYFLFDVGGSLRQQKQRQPSSPARQQDSSASHFSMTIPSPADDAQKPLPLAYGVNRRPPLKDMPPILVADLPSEHIPTYNDATHSQKRLVIIGDVHGQLSALRALLAKVGFDRARGDHLVLTGDMVSKGADSAGVVQLAMDLGASAVRGNHEDRVLAARIAMDEQLVPVAHRIDTTLEADSFFSSSSYADAEADADTDTDTESQTRAENEALATIPSHGDEDARATASSFSEAHRTWLSSLPVILRAHPLPSTPVSAPPWDASELIVVHAGLVPGMPLDRQDPWAVMNMRSLSYPARAARRALVRERLVEAAREEQAAMFRNAPGSPRRPMPLHLPGAARVDEELERLRAEALAAAGEATGEESDPWLAADRAVCVPVSGREGESWSAAWNRHQNGLPRTADRAVVVYGHDAKAGLQVEPRAEFDARADLDAIDVRQREKEAKEKNKSSIGSKEDKKKKKPPPPEKLTGARYAFGLDSGCVYGRQLSAMVIEARPDGLVHRIEQVDCETVGATTEKDADDDDGEED